MTYDKEKKKAYREANKERILAYQKAYREANKERERERNRAWREADKENYLEKAKDRYNQNIPYKLYVMVKAAHKRILGKSIKKKEAVDLLGCTMEEYQGYLESKFQEGMTWENHKKDGWHIDHILPLRESDISEEEKLKRLHYTNTQPLWAKDNISKGNNTVYNPDD